MRTAISTIPTTEYRVRRTEQLSRANSQELQKPADTTALIAAFIADQDARESSKQLYARVLRLYFRWIQTSGRQLNELTRADILEYREQLLNGEADGTRKSTLTVASYLTGVKLFYQWAEASKIYPDIAAGVKLPKRASKFQREPLTLEQAGNLMEEAEKESPRDMAIINLLARCGLRTIEISRANVGDIQVKGGKNILLVQGKGHLSKDNFVILSGKCYQAIRRYLATRTRAQRKADAPLFTSESNHGKGRRLTTRTISAIAKRSLQGIGLDNRSYTAHSLRHTCAVSLLRAGQPLEIVQMTLRHQNPATTQIYTYHLDEQRRLERGAEQQLDKLF